MPLLLDVSGFPFTSPFLFDSLDGIEGSDWISIHALWAIFPRSKDSFRCQGRVHRGTPVVIRWPLEGLACYC